MTIKLRTIEEREAWIKFAAAAMMAGKYSRHESDIAEYADGLLEEFRKRVDNSQENR